MNKQRAKQLADAGGISIGALREMIAKSRGKGGTSSINPQFTHEEVLDIFERALEGREASEIPKTRKDDIYHPGKMKHTRDWLMISNILRVCAP